MSGSVSTLAERILDELAEHGVPLDDDDLAASLGVVRQAVNQACRQLAKRELVVRDVGAAGKIVNQLRTPRAEPARVSRASVRLVKPPLVPGSGSLLTEDEVKQAVKEHLEAQGYEVKVAWARAQGIDLDATKIGGRVVVEAKGAVALQPQQVNYFLGALGELLQRMTDPAARYGLALPDNKQYRGLVSRLPELAKARLGLVVYFVRRQGAGWEVEEVE